MRRNCKLLKHLLFCCSLLINNAAVAESCSKTNADCVAANTWSFGVSLGAGVRTNPLLDGKSIPLVIIPSVAYYGENFFIDNLDIGYTVISRNDWMLNLLMTPADDRIFFERWDIGNILVDLPSSAIANGEQIGSGNDNQNFTNLNANELRTRKISLLGGFEWSADFYQGQIQIGMFHDMSNVHQGNELRFAVSHPIFKTGWNSTFGLSRKDKAMTNYYYGVTPEEVVDDRAAYIAKDSINPFVRLSWKENTSSKDYWRFTLEYQHLSSEIANSPIVDKNYVVTAFIGKQYSF